jgi:hypothetical protein
MQMSDQVQKPEATNASTHWIGIWVGPELVRKWWKGETDYTNEREPDVLGFLI